MKVEKCTKSGCDGVFRYQSGDRYAVCVRCGETYRIPMTKEKPSKVSVPSLKLSILKTNVKKKTLLLMILFGCLLFSICVAGVFVYDDVQFEVKIENQLRDARNFVDTEKYMEAMELCANVPEQSRHYEESQELMRNTEEEYKNSVIRKSTELLSSAQYEAAYNMVWQGKEDLGNLEELTQQENVVRETILSQVTPSAEIVYKGNEIEEGDSLEPELFSIRFDYLGLFQTVGKAEQCAPEIVENAGETEIMLFCDQGTYSWKTNVLPAVVSITATYIGQPPKSGSLLTHAGFEVIGTCTDSSTREITDYQLSNIVMEEYGNHLITVTYKDLSCECYVNVKPQKIGIQLSTKHSMYEKGKSISDEEFEVAFLYEDGSQESIDASVCTYQGRTPRKLGKNTIEVSYDGFTATTEVTGYEYIPLENLEIVSGYGASWQRGTMSDIMGHAYEKPLKINVADLDRTRYAEWYIGGRYNIVEGMIATSKDASDNDQYIISIYADGALVYSSQVCHRRVEPFKFSVHIENVDYLKIETKLIGENTYSSSGTQAILSDLVLVMME